MTKKIIVLAAMLLMTVGCTTVNVWHTEQWEGHFFNENDFYNTTTNIHLKKGESIWVLSNDTLERILENVKK